MTTERLTELRSKVHHGFNLLASEAREVFAHYGEPIDEQMKRCEVCGGAGGFPMSHMVQHVFMCTDCNGTGYEVAK